jgi:nicotinamidase-related amidase
MTTLSGRPNTALLVVDVQNDVVAEAYQREAVVNNIAVIVERARRQQIAVLWIQHSDEELQTGTAGWEIVAQLEPDGREPLIHKHYGDAFEATDLESTLSDLAAGHLVVVGAATDFCIRSTLHGALARGYDVTLVSDAHTTDDLTAQGAPPPKDVIAHTNLYWTSQKAPGRTACTVETADMFKPPHDRMQ